MEGGSLDRSNRWQPWKPAFLAIGTAIVVETIGRIIRLPLAPATGLAATAAAIVYAAVHSANDR